MSVYKPGRPTKYVPATGAGTKPPARPGEYRIRDADANILYIGETDNLARRTGEHIRSGNTFKVSRRTAKGKIPKSSAVHRRER